MPIPQPTAAEQDFSFNDLRGNAGAVTARVPRGYSVRTAPVPANTPAIPGGAAGLSDRERIVENIKVTGPQNTPVAAFTPTAPMQLFIRYQQSDLTRAGGDKSKLKLYYFDGTRWNQFTGIQIVDDPAGSSPGYGRVVVTTQWDADPAIGWSP